MPRRKSKTINYPTTKKRSSSFGFSTSRHSRRSFLVSGIVSQEHRKHLLTLQNEINQRISIKYKAGVREHGGKLWDKSNRYLLEEAINEVVDLAVYLLTLRSKL